MNYWYKLDNAAKIFPSVTTDKRTNVFRLSAIITEEVDPKILEEALNTTIDRFPSLKVRLKRGLFWYYLEGNDAKAIVYPESSHICQRLRRKANNGYLFRVSYFASRINLEVFHSLTDGTGALEMLKALVYNYLLLTGKKINSENLILTDVEKVYEEYQDSFVKNYDSSLRNNKRDRKALQFRGTYYEDHYLSLVTGSVDVSALKEVAKRYQATITEFLTACLIYTGKDLMHFFKKTDRPLQIFVPVNLRRFFPSKTLRNFSLFIATGSVLKKDLNFDEVVATVKQDFEQELVKEKLHERIVANVTIEKNIILRIAPLALKELCMRIGYTAWGDSLNTATFSNLGQVTIPKEMEAYVRKFIFTNGASHTCPVNLGAISYGGKMELTFASTIKERDYQKEFFRFLAGFGLEITLETNELEV
jgi:NRPS condensation-like uncharacterized protein